MSKWSSLVVSLWCGKYEYVETEEIKSYRTFGNHDLITVSPIEGETATEVLKNMWEKTNQFSCNIEAGQSIHNWFAVKKSDNCDTFWNKKSPYLFISAIQLNFKSDIDFDEQLLLFEKELKETLTKEGLRENENYVIYYSLDCGDIILFFETKSYKDGADLINKITIKSKFKHYSYSICGMNTTAILSKKDTEIIPKVVISSVFSDATNYNSWFDKFVLEYPRKLNLNAKKRPIFGGVDFRKIKINCYRDEYVHLARLGNEDICINIFNCDIKHLIAMLCNKTGIFSNNNVLVNATFSRLKIQLDYEICDINPTITREYAFGKSLVSEMSSYWKKKLMYSVNPFIYKALVEVLTASENLEKKEFAFDIQDCIRNVFPLFVKKIEAFNLNGFAFDFDALDSSYSIADFNKDLVYFTTGLMSIANGSLHADKLFINVPGFNAVLCDVPSKLLAYYTAFIQKLVCTLNDTEKYDYKFLLCPDLYLSIEVVPLFGYKKEDDQLLKARIPIKKLFDPEALLMELSHEVAHFVGDKIRHRKERVKILADILSIILSDRIIRPIKFADSDNNTESTISEFNILKTFILEEDSDKPLEDILSSTWKNIPTYISKKLCEGFDTKSKSLLFLENLKKYFMIKTLEVFDNNSLIDGEEKNVIDHIFEIMIDDDVRLEEVENVFLFSKILERHINACIIPEYKTIIEFACSLLSESFSDLIMLYITKDPAAYLKNIYEFEKAESFLHNDINYNSWDEPFICEMKWERVLSVLASLGYKLSDIETSDDEFSDFINALKKYADKNNKFRAVPYHVIDTNTQYLKMCLADLKHYDEKLDDLRKLYVVATTPKSISDCIGAFRKCEFDFRKQIIKDNSIV